MSGWVYSTKWDTPYFFESVGEALSLPLAEYTPPLRRSRLGSPMGELSARTG